MSLTESYVKWGRNRGSLNYKYLWRCVKILLIADVGLKADEVKLQERSKIWNALKKL